MIECLELAVRDLERAGQPFERLGFSCVGKSTEAGRRSWLYMQGEIRIVLMASSSERDPVFQFTRVHGDGLSGLVFRVADPEAARYRAQSRRVGDVASSFVAAGSRERVEDSFREEQRAPGAGRLLQAVDHVTFKVEPGQVEGARALYRELLGEAAGRLIDVRTDAGLGIKAFVESFQGAGIERVAFHASNIELCVPGLKAQRVPFHVFPESDGAEILSEGAEYSSIRQAFTRPMIGPLSFEIIQRKGGTGFGETNLALLVAATRREQNHLGVLA